MDEAVGYVILLWADDIPLVEKSGRVFSTKEEAETASQKQIDFGWIPGVDLSIGKVVLV